MGEPEVEPATSALSELDRRLVRRLVYILTCPFVPTGVPPKDGSCHSVWARVGHTPKLTHPSNKDFAVKAKSSDVVGTWPPA